MVDIPGLPQNLIQLGVQSQSILRFLQVRPKLGPLVMNCTTSEVHGAQYALSDSPIENGSVLTDHKIRLPRVLQMQAIFSPYADNIVDQERGRAQQIDTLARTREATRNPGSSYYQTVWSRIRALADSNETFEIITELEVYKSMVFAEFNHTEQNEGIIRLNATLREIQFSSVRRDLFVKENMADIATGGDDVGLQNLEFLQ